MKEKDRKFLTTEFFKTNSIFVEPASEEDNYIGYISGLAASNHKDRYNDIITDEALIKGAKQLDGITVFKDHDYDVKNAIGKVTKSEFISNGDVSGIKIKVAISKVEKDLWTKIEEEIVNAFSIGGIFNELDYDEKSDTYYIRDFDLWEVSVVGLPANEEATFGALAFKFAKNHKDSLREEAKAKLEEQKLEEEIIMADEPEYLKAIKDMADKLDEITSDSKSRDDALVEITKLMQKQSEVYEKKLESFAPLIAEQAERKELAERKTAMIAKERERVENMSYDEKVAHEQRLIIEATLDPTIDEVLLLGDFEFTWPCHFRGYDELKAEKIRLKVN